MNYEMTICKEIDRTLMYRQLPAHMIVSGFIQGEENCDYQVYLLDYLNASSYFSSLSEGERYRAPVSESDGECDAISSKYEVDFKLMVAQSRMESNSILSASITKYMDGAYIFGTSKVKSEGKSTNLCQALRYKKVDDLIKIFNSDRHSYIDKDILHFLEVLQTKKNILLFLPYEFSFVKKQGLVHSGVESIMCAIWFDLKSCIEYREIHVKNCDTYLATLYNDLILFFKLSSNDIKHIESIDVAKSETFTRLYDIKAWE